MQDFGGGGPVGGFDVARGDDAELLVGFVVGAFGDSGFVVREVGGEAGRGRFRREGSRGGEEEGRWGEDGGDRVGKGGKSGTFPVGGRWLFRFWTLWRRGCVRFWQRGCGG